VHLDAVLVFIDGLTHGGKADLASIWFGRLLPQELGDQLGI
jgi:hypothetical protein